MNPIMNPKEIAQRGEEIYRDDLQSAFEREHLGKFVAIDIYTKQPYVADAPEEALRLAREDAPKGIFHLIKVGAPGAFRVSYSKNVNLDWQLN